MTEYCSLCGIVVNGGLMSHIEANHVESPANQLQFKWKCGDCDFKVKREHLERLGSHCLNTRHNPASIVQMPINIKKFIRDDEKRVKEIIQKWIEVKVKEANISQQQNPPPNRFNLPPPNIHGDNQHQHLTSPQQQQQQQQMQPLGHNVLSYSDLTAGPGGHTHNHGHMNDIGGYLPNYFQIGQEAPPTCTIQSTVAFPLSFPNQTIMPMGQQQQQQQPQQQHGNGQQHVVGGGPGPGGGKSANRERAEETLQSFISDVIQLKPPSEKEKKKRRKVARPDCWKRNIIKEQRSTGKSYVNAKGVLVEAKVPKDMTKHVCRFECGEVTEEDRVFVNHSYWQRKSYERKKDFILDNVVSQGCKRRRTLTKGEQEEAKDAAGDTDPNNTSADATHNNSLEGASHTGSTDANDNQRRTQSVFYFMTTKQGNRYRVCQDFFTATLSIGKHTVYKAIQGRSPDGACFVLTDGRGKHSSRRKGTKLGVQKNASGTNTT